MTDAASFASADQGAGEQTTDITGFQDKGSQGGGGQELTPEEVAALRKRDEHAQQHIQRLEQEAKDRAAQFAEMQEKLKALEEAQVSQDTLKELLAQRANDQAGTQTETKQIDVQALADQVAAQMAQRRQAEVAKENLNSAINAAKQVFGADKFVEEIGKRASEMGMSMQEVDALASRSPAAFERLFIGTKGGTQTATGAKPGSLNAAALAKAQEQASAAADVREVYQKTPSKYFTPENYERVLAQLRSK